MYWLNHHFPKHKAFNRFSLLFCSFSHILEPLLFNLSVHRLPPTSVSPYTAILSQSRHAYFCYCIEALCIMMEGCYGDCVICHEENLLCLRSFSTFKTWEWVSMCICVYVCVCVFLPQRIKRKLPAPNSIYKITLLKLKFWLYCMQESRTILHVIQLGCKCTLHD